MKKNMGAADVVIRMAVAIIMIILLFKGGITGTVAYLLGAIAAIFLITGTTGFCPLYRLFGISTKKK